ncbi:hypothetical protein LJC58_07635 [Lachnospiraceae bacterium OttesenSCG-928-D06]|nr:hypothetical protein [Lachnospiraceae bacterium OttesenSCG-928-D06]
MRKDINVILIFICTLCLTGCANNGQTDVGLSSVEINEDIVTESNLEESQCFYGTWYIDRVVLTSTMYTGTTKDGDFEENVYDPEDYLGFEIEYSYDFSV